MNYYNRHVGDYLKDTSHLSLLEHGIYCRLLDVYYTREGAIPDDQAARLIGARSKEERAALTSVLKEFFQLNAGVWTQGRCELEIEHYKDKEAKAKASADARWKHKPEHTERNANASPDAMRTHTERTADGMQRAPVPITNNQEPIAKKEKEKRASLAVLLPDVDPAVASDFEALRKAKKAPLTATAIDCIRREAAKAGLTMQTALETSCSRGWTGFKAEWVASNPTHGSHAPTETAWQKSQRERVAQFAPGLAAKAPGGAVIPITIDMEDQHGTALSVG